MYRIPTSGQHDGTEVARARALERIRVAEMIEHAPLAKRCCTPKGGEAGPTRQVAGDDGDRDPGHEGQDIVSEIVMETGSELLMGMVVRFHPEGPGPGFRARRETLTGSAGFDAPRGWHPVS